jgi:zinc protease
MTFYHLPEQYLNTYLDRVKAVTIQDIKRAFQKEVHPDQLVLITVGQS